MSEFGLLITRRTWPKAGVQEGPQAKVGREGVQVSFAR